MESGWSSVMSKGKKERQPFNIFWLVVLAAMCVVIIADVSRADEISSGRDCAGKSSACANQLVDIAGDSSKALGLGFSSPSFGTAIAQCVATEASNFVFGAYGKQKVVVNYWCMGSSLYQLGKYDAAARVWCAKTDLGDLYLSEGECVSALSASPEAPAEEAPVVVYEEDMHAAEIEEQQMLIADLAAKYENLAAAEPQTQTIERTIVVPKLSESQRTALAEVKE